MAQDARVGRARAGSKVVTMTTRLDLAREVILTGDFTKWSLTGGKLAKGPDGAWRISFNIAPGRYQYRLIVDGQWSDHAEAQERVANPFGTQNCVLVVT